MGTLGWLRGVAGALAVCLATQGAAQDVVPVSAPAAAAQTGPVTNLPLPRYVSLKASEANVRRGPSLTHRIDWVFQRRGMPLQVVAEYGHWRRVIDRDGQGGWVHYTMLSGVRTALVTEQVLTLHSQPDANASERAYLEQGVVARLGACERNWCELNAEGYRGWAPQAAIWGVDPDETKE
ncbi:hypothetical protein AN189_06000 [Loktanella sp. 3ANDIMAR09]|uniref:SH3 domain-containing protein n=1 Tax=Loktanella sp. 3ANDIMAR09 TaxID=1225657 RepID=UPI0006FF4C42|nr:SH3 domain-containing protein [Loktanella sp. 3ANDIMAR09]KQI69130.1 hypothetical protein AN189_06000 [Loktanella sp. 3ANDIMAR09]